MNEAAFLEAIGEIGKALAPAIPEAEMGGLIADWLTPDGITPMDEHTRQFLRRVRERLLELGEPGQASVISDVLKASHSHKGEQA
jgi:hypothetical protein